MNGELKRPKNKIMNIKGHSFEPSIYSGIHTCYVCDNMCGRAL